MEVIEIDRAQSLDFHRVVDRGVVDEVIDAAIRLDCRVGHGVRAHGIGNIDLGGERGAAFRPDLVGDASGLRLVEIGDDHFCPRRRQTLRVLFTDTLTRTRDDRDLVIETPHCRYPRSRSPELELRSVTGR